MEKVTRKNRQLKLSQVELDGNLQYLRLPYMADNYDELAATAAKSQWDHVRYLTALVEGESNNRRDRATQRRVRQARFPVVKTMDQFQWTWPKKINRQQVQNLFRLKFIEEKSNIIILGGVGLGRTHLATAQAAGNFHKELRAQLYIIFNFT